VSQTQGAPRWGAVLFDLDGTLADTVELILRSYRHTMKAHLGRELPDERWLANLGRPLRYQLRGFARDEEETDAMFSTYVAFQKTVHDRMVGPYPGVREVVARLRQSGVLLGVVTSKRRTMAERTLSRCGLDGEFDVIVCADDVARGKPDPEPVRLALARLGLSAQPERVLFVGDSPFDVRAGMAAGVRTAGALWGPFDRTVIEAERPDYVLSRIEDLLTVVID